MSSAQAVSLYGRYKIIALAGVIILILGALAFVRAGRLANSLGRGRAFDRVKSVLVKRLGIAEAIVKPEAALETLQPEGINRNELASAFQEEFGADISEEDVNRLVTVEDAVRLLDSKGAPKR